MRRASARVHGRSVHLLEAGSGPSVILVHGIGLAGDVWRPSLETLARDGWRTLAPDLPCFGDSSGPWWGLDTDRLVDWLGDFAAAVDAEQAAWVGHSLFNRAVLRLATERQPALALALISPTTRRGALQAARQALRLTQDALRERPRVLLAVLRRYARAAPLGTLGTWLRDDGTPLERLAAGVGSPVLIAAGTRDPMSLPGDLERLARTFPRGRLVRVEGTAHGLALDARGFVAELLRAFLAEIRAGDDSVG